MPSNEGDTGFAIIIHNTIFHRIGRIVCKRCVGSHLPDFDYGRIDLKIENWNSFKTKTGIKILEINGVNSEPIHIYDPNFSIWNAYKTIFKHMHIIYQLSQHKLNNQSQTLSLFEFISGARKVLSKKGASQISYT